MARTTEKDEQIGARQIAKRSGKALWLALLALLVLLLAAVAAWFLFVDDDGDVEAVDTTATTSATSAPTSQATMDGSAAPAAGEVFAGGQRVLPGGEGELTRFVGQASEGRTVRVQSVPSDESFWVGTSNTNRVFVHLALSPRESPFNVQAGEMVTFSGTVKAVPSDVGSRFALTAAEGLGDLRTQGAYIEATKVTKG